MSSLGTSPPCAASQRIAAPWREALAARLADYVELTKPRIAVMVLVTVSVGFALAGDGRVDLVRLAHALVGIGLVAGGSSALNQWLERTTDARMPRTADRPLPSGRLAPAEVLCFGLAAAAAGIAWLLALVNVATAVLALATLGLYVLGYTPLKRATTLCTAVGAVPGALPPVLGWAAATGEAGGGAWLLFAILFLWQFPHFLAIAWLYREQYRRAGLRMLPGGEGGARVAGFLCVGYALALVPVSLLPAQQAVAGSAYALAALVLGAGYVAAAARFLFRESAETARGLLWASLVYLPVLLLTMTWDHFQLLK
ncbi:MAG TPA: heme o synthase [Planctomycetaceae bacterium]|nr:heme o synthase [Planctomycetaceae bacterium]